MEPKKKAGLPLRRPGSFICSRKRDYLLNAEVVNLASDGSSDHVTITR